MFRNRFSLTSHTTPDDDIDMSSGLFDSGWFGPIVGEIARVNPFDAFASQFGLALSGGDAGADGSASRAQAANVAPQPLPGFHTVDALLHADTARTHFAVSGANIKIGILSTGFDLFGNGDLAFAQHIGAVGQVSILKDASTDQKSQFAASDDEGLAMAEIVHSIAPNAQIYYYTAEGGPDEMAKGVAALAAAGCNIICDDFNYFQEPFYQANNPVSVAIDAAVAQGVTYFTCATNLSRNGYYENAFAPGNLFINNQTLPGIGGNQTTYNFGGSPYEDIFVPGGGNGGTLNLALQWNQPFFSINGVGASYSLNYVLYDQGFNNIVSIGKGASGNGNGNQVGGDPVQFDFVPEPNADTIYHLAIFFNGGSAPGPGDDIFKIIMGNHSDTLVQFWVNGTNTVDPNSGPTKNFFSGTMSGHNEVASAITVGASKPNNPTVMEEFSSSGPGVLLRDTNGNPLANAIFLDGVDLTAPDGNPTTVFPNFFGTSASTPAAAAVAALMLQANANLGPVDIRNIMQGTALALADPLVSGAGLLNADKSVGVAKTLNGNGNTDTWKLGINGDFAVANNWNLGFVPGPHINAALTVAGTYTVTSKHDITVNGVTTSKTATLSIADSDFTMTNGTGKGANAGSIQIGEGAVLTVGGTVNNTNNITLGGNTKDTFLFLPNSLTLNGTGTIALSNSTHNIIQGDSAGDTLINATNKIVGAGQIGNGFMSLTNKGFINATGTMDIEVASNTNSGTLEATTAAGVLNLDTAVTNTGTILATAGKVNIHGGVTNSKIIEATGTGVVTIDSIIINTATGIVESIGAGSHVDLTSATIAGGTLTTASGGLIEIISHDDLFDGRILAVKNTGTVQINDKAGVAIEGTISNTGTITVNANGHATDIVVIGTATLQGAGKILMTNDTNNGINSALGDAKLTNIGNTISGAGTIGDDHFTLLNKSGVINASGTQELTIHTGFNPVANGGMFEGTGTGGLVLDHVIVNDTATGIIEAFANSHVDLSGATINGGAMKTVAGGSIHSVAGDQSVINAAAITNAGLFQADTGGRMLIIGNVTNSGTLEADGGNLTVNGNITNTGNLVADNADLRIFNTASIGGTATIANGGVLEIAGASTTKVTFADASNATLVLDQSTKFSGASKIAQFQGDNRIDMLDLDPNTAHIVSYVPGAGTSLVSQTLLGLTVLVGWNAQ